MPSTSVKKCSELVGVGRQQLDRAEVGDLAHAAPSTFARSPSRSYESAPAASFSPFTRSFSSRSRAAASTSSTRSAATTAHAVGVEHDHVAGADLGAADGDRDVELAGLPP